MSIHWGFRVSAALPILILALNGGVAGALVPSTGAMPLADETPVTVVPDAAAPRLAADLNISDDSLSTSSAATADQLAQAATVADQTASDSEVECMAKVVLHEAGGQSHRGQLAVAQVIRARMKAGRFGENACDVVRQPGQFFNVDAYNPSRDTDRWAAAVAIARQTLAGNGDDVAPGALFFHAASSRGRWVGSRTRVAQIDGQVFYR